MEGKQVSLHKMPEPFDPAYVTLFAELGERVSDAGLIEGLPPGGTFELRSVNGREYWYHRAYNRATRKDTVRYVGPATAALSARIERHRGLKPDIRGRRQLVSTLKRAGFPAPDTFTGEVIAAHGAGRPVPAARLPGRDRGLPVLFGTARRAAAGDGDAHRGCRPRPVPRHRGRHRRGGRAAARDA